MMKRKHTRELNKQAYDSIQINKDGSYYQTRHSGLYMGNWIMNVDSIRLFVLPSSPTHPNSGWIITELFNASLHLKQYAGKEGESKTWKYKFTGEAGN